MKFFHKILFTLLIAILILYPFRIILNKRQKFVFKKQLRTENFSIVEPNIVNDFKRILNNQCNPTNINLNSTCIQSIKRLTKHILKDDCSQCLIINNRKQYVYYHTYWDIEPNNESYQQRVLKLNLLSYLATQNLCCTKFILWKSNKFPKNLLSNLTFMFSNYLNIIQFKTFNTTELCKTTQSFKDHNICQLSSNEHSNYKNIVGFSDFVRFFVLDQYGGIYTDGDVIYLQNMQLFWYFNFAYRWSFLTDKINTAVLGINKLIDPAINNLYDRVLLESSNLEQLVLNFHPHLISIFVEDFNNKSIFKWIALQVLHSYLFDSAWLCNDGLVKRFNTHSICAFIELSKREFVNETEFQIEDFFPGAFNYHIHLKQNGPDILENSYFVHLEKYFMKKLVVK